MKKLLILTPALFISAFVICQSMFGLPQKSEPVDFGDCAAIFYEGEMLVDEYSPRGKCKLEEGMKGTLAVSTVMLSEEESKPIKSLDFYVAIKNVKTNTQYLFSEKPVKTIQLEDILEKCNSGDNIIIMTTDRKNSLSHHEIEIKWGC